MTRATMSGVPPAACGTIILTGREGQLCALAMLGVRATAASSERNAQRMVLSCESPEHRHASIPRCDRRMNEAHRNLAGGIRRVARGRGRARSISVEADPPDRSL